MLSPPPVNVLVASEGYRCDFLVQDEMVHDAVEDKAGWMSGQVCVAFQVIQFT